jgi:hypothetical protein
MSEYLNISQMKHLQDVLSKRLVDKENEIVEKIENEEYLNLF